MAKKPVSKESVRQLIGIAKAQDRKRMDTWKTIDQMLRNDFGAVTLPNGDEVPKIAPNIILNQLNVIMPLLYFNDPDFYVIAQSAQFQAQAEVNEKVLNYYWRILRAKREMRHAIANALAYRAGFIKVGMPISQYPDSFEAPDEGEQKQQAQAENMTLLLSGEDVKVNDTDDDATHNLIHNSILDDPAVATILEVQPEARDRILKHITAHNERPIKEERALDLEPLPIEKPFLKSISSKHMFFEPGIDHWNESGYVFHRRGVRLADLKASPIYKVPADLTPSGLDPEILQLLGQDTDDSDLYDADRALAEYPDFGIVWIYELMHRPSKTLSTWVEGVDDPIRDFQDWPYHDIEGYNIKVLSYSDVPGMLAGPSPLEMLMFPQAMLKRLYGQVGDHTDKSGSVAEVYEAGLTPESKQQLDEILGDPTHGRALKKSIPERVLTYAGIDPLDPAILGLISMIETGTVPQNSLVSPVSQGGNPSATASSIQASQSNTETQDKINLTEDFQVECARMVLGVLKEYGPVEEEILTDLQKPEYLVWRRQDIVPSVMIMIESPTPTDSERDRAMSLNLYHELRDSPHLEGTGRMEMEKDVLRTHGRKVYQKYMRNPDPEVQASVDSEHAAFANGQYRPAVLGQNHTGHLHLHTQRLNEVQQGAQQRQQAIMQQVQQGLNGSGGGEQQFVQAATQLQQNDQQIQAMSQELQLLQAHMQQHQEVQQQTPDLGGRRRNPLPQPDGNTGRVHSIVSAQSTGG